MKKVTLSVIGKISLKIALKIWVFLLDTIAPPDPVVRRIENMSVDDFMRVVVRAAHVQQTQPNTEQSKSGYVRPKLEAILSYKDPLVKTTLLEVKSYGNKKLALLLGSVLYTHLCAELAQDRGGGFTYIKADTRQHSLPPLIIPIPITKKSLRARGWNQCELIAAGLKNADGQKTTERRDHSARFEIRTDILYKIRETADQVGKGRHERFENLKNSFAVKNPEKVRGREVILFDDILTTGATLGEAARAIQSAGASHVTCIALAH